MSVSCVYMYVHTHTYAHIYACMSLCYAFPYVSLCEAFLVKRIHYISWEWKWLQSKICILLEHHADQWKLYFEYSITSIIQIHLQTTAYEHLLDLKLLKLGWKLKQSLELPILMCELCVSTSKDLYFKVSMARCSHYFFKDKFCVI